MLFEVDTHHFEPGRHGVILVSPHVEVDDQGGEEGGHGDKEHAQTEKNAFAK